MTEPKPVRPPRVKEPQAMSARDTRTVEAYVQNSVPEKHRLATLRALKGQTMKAAAAKLKCLQCAGYQREEVTLCPVITCALHFVRPYQK